MKYILSFLRNVSDCKIFEHHFSPPRQIEYIAIGIQWCISIENVCFVTDIQGMN
jgi:hypothetical protein